MLSCMKGRYLPVEMQGSISFQDIQKTVLGSVIDDMTGRFNVTQYSLLPRSLPIRPTRPASRVTQLGLPTSGADETIREEGSATYIHTRPINGCSATLIKWPTLGSTHWAS